jgi:hypothetical protein
MCLFAPFVVKLYFHAFILILGKALLTGIFLFGTITSNRGKILTGRTTDFPAVCRGQVPGTAKALLTKNNEPLYRTNWHEAVCFAPGVSHEGTLVLD